MGKAVLSAIWLGCFVLSSLQVKSTVRKYGSRKHNRLKSLFTFIPALFSLMYCGGNIKFALKVLPLYVVSLGSAIMLCVVRNKLIETTPVFITNSLSIITYVETFIIDILIGTISLDVILLICAIIKLIGIILCTIEYDGNPTSKKVYGTIFLLSLIIISRAYSTSFLINNGYITTKWILVLHPFSVWVYSSIKYRKEKLDFNLGYLKDYTFQGIVTTVRDYIYFNLICVGVNNTVDLQIVGILILMGIESKSELDKSKKLGMGLVILGWIIYIVVHKSFIPGLSIQ